MSLALFQAARIPPRYWVPKADPFLTYPEALQWWEERHQMVRDGRGLVAISDSDAPLAGMVELLKRMITRGGAAWVPPDMAASWAYRCIDATNVMLLDLGEDLEQLADGEDLYVSARKAAVLVLANCGAYQKNNWMYPQLLLHRYNEQLVTFVHFCTASTPMATITSMAAQIRKEQGR